MSWKWVPRTPEDNYPVALSIFLSSVSTRIKTKFNSAETEPWSSLVPTQHLCCQMYRNHCRKKEFKIATVLNNLERRAQESALLGSDGGLVECFNLVRMLPQVHDVKIAQKKLELELLLAVATRQFKYMQEKLGQANPLTKWSPFIAKVIVPGIQWLAHNGGIQHQAFVPPPSSSSKFLNNYSFLDGVVCINLHSRPDRWREMCAQFTNCNIPLDRVSRMQAIDFEIDGCLGCTESHKFACIYALLKQWWTVWITEDDSDQHAKIHEAHLKKFFALALPFTVLMLHANIQKCTPPREIKLVGQVRQIHEASLMDSYILNACMYIPMISCMQQGAQNLRRTKKSWIYICDQYWKQLQKTCQPWYSTMPELSFQRPDHSDLRDDQFVDHQDVNSENKRRDDLKIDKIG
jgi:hypothetical protein